MLSIGFLWTHQVFTGQDGPPRWGSRVTATLYGVASALTLDEFSLWLELGLLPEVVKKLSPLDISAGATQGDNAA